MGHTRLLAELRREDAAEFGAKSANLGELLAAGIPVPPGFAIAASAYRELGSAVSPELREELAARYAELGDPPVAVRSSALGEDSQEASYAGQAESYLWVRGLDELCEAVRECWASLDSERAVAYRARLGAGEAAMGVAVQKMVDAEVSGVMFTCNPVSGDPSVVAVDASWGLGLAVVGGETNPDEYLVSKVTGEIVRRAINSKAIEYVVAADGRGTARVEVTAERREAPCLDDERLAELVALAKTVERHFGSHQDVEWAIERGTGKLHTLQARPVTVTREAPAVSGSAISLVMDAFGARNRT
ncbi:MAG TPA: PEP/pyruvate-binding domain-containing protein [Gaiellaceae bacterium]|nr:PEP/pyruvate-binding domain-containing protein [Gaiellaceae bacterium]